EAGAARRCPVGVVNDGQSDPLTPISFTGETCALAPDGKTLAVAAWDGRVQLWDVTTGKPGHRLGFARDRSVPQFLQWSGDGKQLVARAGAEHFAAWDAATGKELARHGQPPDG